MAVQVASMEWNRVTPASFPANNGSIADCDRIEYQAILPFVKTDAIHVAKRSALRGADVIKDRAGGRGRCGLTGQPKSFKG
jgi:hypothetical protein